VPGATTIIWFRRDLRLHDNPALLEAVRASDGDVAALFVIDHVFVAPSGPARTRYLHQTLDALNDSIDGALIVRRGEPSEELARLARELDVRQVFATGDFGPRGRHRDEHVRNELARLGLSVNYVDSPYVVAPGIITTKTGTPCRVFGAFQRGWHEHATTGTLPAPSGVRWRRARSVSLGELDEGSGQRRPSFFPDVADDLPPHLAPAGEQAGLRLLKGFDDLVDDYEEARNLPGRDATSRLSPFLRYGALHPRQVLSALDGTSTGRATFRSEVCWREFYADVMYRQPNSAWQSLQPAMRQLRWDTGALAEERFALWANGQTGFPLVDAGMRQLLSEGWMHNRVRMITASFLVKHLHVDWRWGAKWFMWHLIDGDLASNQHGWQWVAGTGTDPSPFHRIFNPTLQATRFDPQGTYVHRYVPELRSVPAPQCLEPGGGTGMLRASDYPFAMIDAALERDEALSRFHDARERARVAS
jgi:deoxyribodipyrimidine photo-lyase